MKKLLVLGLAGLLVLSACGNAEAEKQKQAIEKTRKEQEERNARLEGMLKEIKDAQK